ncbi:MAG: preprotein translocase subunit SecG [Firmicutes bacterium]|nr:preprotein translocase subunit SecG [Bacillota bacterium]MBO2518329.1 preprotein translocase subunit SecG [Bacillota bacterium]
MAAWSVRRDVPRAERGDGVTTALMVLELIVGILLMGVFALQRSKGEGLGSIGGGAQMFFEQSKGLDRFLEQAMTVLGILLMVFAVGLALVA